MNGDVLVIKFTYNYEIKFIYCYSKGDFDLHAGIQDIVIFDVKCTSFDIFEHALGNYIFYSQIKS